MREGEDGGRHEAGLKKMGAGGETWGSVGRMKETQRGVCDAKRKDKEREKRWQDTQG